MCLNLCLDLSSMLPLCYICLFLYISLVLFLALSIFSLFACLSVFRCNCGNLCGVCLQLRVSCRAYTYIYLSPCLSVCLPVSLCVCISVSLSVCLSMSACLCLSVSSSLSSLLLASHRIFSIPLPIDPVGRRLVRPWRPQSTSLDRCSCLSSLYRTSDGSEARHLRQQFLLHQRADDGHYPISHIR